jgi:hypothetical protein
VDVIERLDALRDTYSVLGAMTFEWNREPLTDPPIRLTLKVVYHSTTDPRNVMVLRFDGVDLDVFAPSVYSERFDLYVSREGRDRGWEKTYRVTDEHGDWIAFWCSDLVIEESVAP